MALTHSFHDFRNDGFATTGAPVDVDDLWNPKAARDYDGSVDREVGPKPLALGVQQGTWLVWVNIPTQTSAWILSMHTGGGGEFFFMEISNGATDTFFAGAANGSNNLTVQKDGSGIGGGGWVRIGFRVNGATDEIDLCFNGVVYSTYTSKDKGGTGYAGHSSGIVAENISIAAHESIGQYTNGTVGRIDLYDEYLSDAALLADYNNELAAQGEGFGGDGTIIDTLTPKLPERVTPKIYTG